MGRLLLLNLVLACVINPICAQDSRSRDREQYVVVPSDQGLALTVSQPDCPLKFEDPKLLAKKDGHWIPSFRLRNTGSKPIRALTVAAAGAGEWGWRAPNPTHYLMPGHLAPLGEDTDCEIIALTVVLREKLKLQGEMKGVMALIVVRVEYADGSFFQDSAYPSLKAYFEKLYLRATK